MTDNERIAKRAVEIAEELRAALPRNTDFSDGWQQRYLDRQNERFEQALEMARAEFAELGWKTPELTEDQWREAAKGTVASRAPDIRGLDEQDLPNGVAPAHEPQPERRCGTCKHRDTPAPAGTMPEPCCACLPHPDGMTKWEPASGVAPTGEREQFEEWSRSRPDGGFTLDRYSDPECTDYIHWGSQLAWESWQASAARGVMAAPATDWLDEAMKLAEDYARAWQHDADGSYVVKDQAPKAKDKLREHLAGVNAPDGGRR